MPLADIVLRSRYHGMRFFIRIFYLQHYRFPPLKRSINSFTHVTRPTYKPMLDR
jgi:hypothetical protein